MKMNSKMMSLLKKVSRTLYLSFAVLPDYLKNMLGCGYLICRAMDSVVDSENFSTHEKKKILYMFRNLYKEKDLIEELRKFGEKLNIKGEKELLLNFDCVLDFIRNFEDKDKALIKMLVRGVSKGMEMDLDFFNSREIKAFKTEVELINYCKMIGGVPGIYWYEVYNRYMSGKLHDAAIKNSAYQIGIGLQLTNILKDISLDAEKKRCYLPLEDLKPYNLQVNDIINPENINRFRPIINKWIIYAVDMLDSSEVFLLSIEKTHFQMRAAVIWPVYWALDTLHQVSILNPLSKKCSIKKKEIYSTILKTPSMLLSNTVFQRGYRFRRETLITEINNNIS